MAAILTSIFRPQKITIVILLNAFRNDRVMFLVWDWPSESRGTIEPTGFGTHGGEGGAGLSSVLGLIRFYDIPINHAFTYDNDMYRAFSEEGILTPQMFDMLKATPPCNWNYYPTAEVRLVKNNHAPFLEVDYWKFPITPPAPRKWEYHSRTRRERLRSNIWTRCAFQRT
jgi:hypothetical protein